MSEQTPNEQTINEEPEPTASPPPVEQQDHTENADGQDEATSGQAEEASTHGGSPDTEDNSKEDDKVLNKNANQDLLNAALIDDGEGVENALQEGADINSKDEGGETALHLASRFGFGDMAETLLKNNADVQIKDNDGWSPLHGAAFGGHRNIAELLINHGSEIDEPNDDGLTPLMRTIWSGHRMIADLLLQNGARVDTQDYDGWTALHFATCYGDADIVQLILSHDPDINIANQIKWTALHYATRYQSSETVQVILSHNPKPNVNFATNDGWTALHFATRYQDSETVQMLLSHDADINVVDDDGWTALHFATCYQNSKTVQRILSHNPDVNLANNNGWTALHFATRYQDYETVRMLLSHHSHPDINVTNKKGWTALQFATRYGDFETVQMLLFHDADINIADEDGWTALHKVPYNDIEKGRERIAGQLIKKGAHFIATQDDHQTPLHKASDKQCPDVVRQLLKHESPMVDDTDQDGWTALHYASRNGDGETVSLLLGRGANCELKVPGSEQSALALAVSTLFGTWAEHGTLNDKKTLNEKDTLKEKDGKIETMKSAENVVTLIASNSTDVEKQLVIRQLEIGQDDRGKHLDALVNLMNMTGPKKEETKLIWYASKQDYHFRVHEILSDKGLSPKNEGFVEMSPLQLAAYHGKHAVVWWLLKTTPDSRNAKLDREQAIKLARGQKAVEKDSSLSRKNQKKRDLDPSCTEIEQGTNSMLKGNENTDKLNYGIKSTSKGKEKRDQKRLNDDLQDEEFDYELTINMLKDPPPVVGMADSYRIDSGPSLGISETLVDDTDATIVDFYRQDGRVDFLRRSYPLRHVIYETASSGGPEEIMAQARETLKRISPEAAKEKSYTRDDLRVRWVHLPANNMKLMEDLTQRVYYDKKSVKDSSYSLQEIYSSLRGFLQKSWHEVTNGSPASNFMKPSCSKGKVGEDFVSRNTTQERARKVAAVPEPAQQASETENTSGRHEKEDERDEKYDQKQQPVHRNDRKHNDRGIFEATALYIPFVAFGKCHGAQEKFQPDSGDVKRKDDHAVHETRSLDQFYYHSLKDIGDRDKNQVATRTLMELRNGEEVENKEWWPIITVDQLWLWVIDEETIITCATQKKDGLDDLVVDKIFNRLRDDQFKGNRRPPPSSVDELSRFIVRFCIDFIHTATWENSVSENPKDWTGKVKEYAASWSAKDIFTDAINKKATEEKVLFDKFKSKMEERENNSQKKQERFPGERTPDEGEIDDSKDWKAIRGAAQLLHEVKDIRDEITMLQALLSQQKTVWGRLLPSKSKPEGEGGVPYIIQDFQELGATAKTIQSSVQNLLSLEQNGISITEAILSRTQAKESVKQGKESVRQGQESARQGKSIMVFTIVTIVFTPMSFLSSLFALNVSTFQHDSEGNLFYHPGWIYPMIFCVSIAITVPLLVVAVYVEEIRKIWIRFWSKNEDPPPKSKEGHDSSQTERQNRGSFSKTDKTDSSGNSDPPEPREGNCRDQIRRFSRLIFRKSRRSAEGEV